MRLNQQTDYALRLLMHIATTPNDIRVTIADIANWHNISRTHLMKVANNLSRGGFIEASRGRTGGLKLGRPPNEISIGSVVRHMETDLAIAECLQSNNSTCKIIGACRLKASLRQALEAFLNVLDDVTLTDLTYDNAQLFSIIQYASSSMKIPVPNETMQ